MIILTTLASILQSNFLYISGQVLIVRPFAHSRQFKVSVLPSTHSHKRRRWYMYDVYDYDRRRRGGCVER